MKLLGISYGYHDASASVVVDGVLIAAAAEERFTRQKHDANFPRYAIGFCLEQAGLSLDDIDGVVFHEDPHTKFSRVLTSSLAPFPGSRREFVSSVRSWIGKKLWALGAISSRLGMPPDCLWYLGHHMSHGVQAFVGSGFDEAAVLVVDAVGDWSSTALFRGHWKDGKTQLERIVEIAFPNSLGLVYSALTAYLGFRPNDSECSTMALAAFGQPRFADFFREVIAACPDGTYQVDPSYFNFSNFYRGAFTDRLVDRLGPPRAAGSPLELDCFSRSAPRSEDTQRFADVAASIQLVIEERLLGLCAYLHQVSGSTRLCYAGGVALNCVANGRIRAESPFEQIYIPVDPGDGGTAVATALYGAALLDDGVASVARPQPYLGSSAGAERIVSMLEHIEPSHVRPYVKRGVEPGDAPRWLHQRFDDEGELCAWVASRLMDRQIVGWFQGRFELGPRALGNRSLLCRPDDLALARRMSRLVKERAAYRPYAFSCTPAAAEVLLDVPPAWLNDLRWMQLAVRVREEALPRVRAAVHIDNTSRPQVCSEQANPRYHRLLHTFKDQFGLGVLLNTSFNPRGYPMVATPVEALAMFARTDMDVLVVGETVIHKARGDRET